MGDVKTGKLTMTVGVYDHEYSASGPEDMDIDHLFGRIIIPLVLSMGYQRDSIAKLFVDGMPTEWDSAYDE